MMRDANWLTLNVSLSIESNIQQMLNVRRMKAVAQPAGITL